MGVLVVLNLWEFWLSCEYFQTTDQLQESSAAQWINYVSIYFLLVLFFFLVANRCIDVIIYSICNELSPSQRNITFMGRWRKWNCISLKKSQRKSLKERNCIFSLVCSWNFFFYQHPISKLIFPWALYIWCNGVLLVDLYSLSVQDILCYKMIWVTTSPQWWSRGSQCLFTVDCVCAFFVIINCVWQLIFY